MVKPSSANAAPVRVGCAGAFTPTVYLELTGATSRCVKILSDLDLNRLRLKRFPLPKETLFYNEISLMGSL